MSKASEFIEALHRIEEGGDVEPMTRLFAPDAELSNPTITRPLIGPEGAREFWRAYRSTFVDVKSEFRCIVESDKASTLEWTSRGTLAQGTPFSYHGVSVIEHPAGAITGFRAYFDPRSLGLQLEHAA
ncbi:epoxide hydrolase [Sorangium cellulosum]|uniref:Epoxide hydrolase n=1 Tax=Sorangium cellulosum TaxID=56 RepID=A0A2L0FAE3_SORCE|nr:nuclear transport factor 2 family protein [Sorangium cellulosum]AUX48467.1 epoxide hydrolase [Sorangium cellulosum]